MLSGLAWDEEESTQESIRALKPVPPPSSEWPPSEIRRDTIVELDESSGWGPSTERAPATVSSAKVDDVLTHWEDGDPTRPQPRTRASSHSRETVAVESAAPGSLGDGSMDDHMPDSAIRRSSDRHPKSIPLPLLDGELDLQEQGTLQMADEEDMRATLRRDVVSLSPDELQLLPESLPSMRAPLPSQVVVDERLLGEVAALRRWLRFSLAMGLMALVVSAVLAVLLVSTPAGGSTLRLGSALGGLAPTIDTEPPPPVAAVTVEQGIKATTDQVDLRMIVDGVERGTLPVTVRDLEPGVHEVRFEGGEAFASEKRRVMVPEGEMVDLGEVALKRERVEVLIALSNPYASVALTPIGGLPEPVSGPWPKTIYLPEGKYTLTAAKRGKRAQMVMLDLSLDKPKREIQLRIR